MTESPGILPAADRVVLVSGANRGIGRAVAERLYRDGYRLSLAARRVETLAPVVAAMDSERAMTHHYDALDADSAGRWAAATAAHFGRIDAVVNNAGIMHPFRLEDDDETALDAMWEVNVKGPLRLVRAAWAHLKQAGTGRVVSIVSMSGKRVKSERSGGYAMSKFAANALQNTLRHAGWTYGIRATAICPGFVATDMTAQADFPRTDMTTPASVAHLVAMVLALPNTASVKEVPVNCMLETDG